MRIPACTAYAEPEPDAVRFSERDGITGWSDGRINLSWFGRVSAGPMTVQLLLRLPTPETATLRLTVGKERREASPGAPDAKGLRTVDFGTIAAAAGYVRLRVDGLTRSGATFGEIDALELSGPAVGDAHFNLKERRNAASVHLGYPQARELKAAWFYNEVNVQTDPLWSYYMACGWHRGYFGIQVNSPTERRIIFSVWDSGNEAVDRNKVSAADRVTLLAKGPGVVADSFGNEGTGGHSHLVYPWRKGETYKFLVTAEPSGTDTTYAGWFFFPERNAWGLIARFKAPRDGSHLKGLYSFNENFWGANGHLKRLCEFGPIWVKSSDGVWREQTTARFTHDPTGREDRKDYDAGVARSGRFYLSNGGFAADSSLKYGDTIPGRSSGGRPPMIALPA